MKANLPSFLLILFWGLSLHAQRTAQLETNNLKAIVCDNGGLFQNYSARDRLTVLNTGGQSIMFNAGLWFAASIGNVEYTAVQEEYIPLSYPDLTTDFSAGPITNDYNNPQYLSSFQRVWKIHRDDITYHLSHYQDPGYFPLSSIADWPAHGDTNRGEAYYLAPFYDANGNQAYDPENGDYPIIRGDEALYMIYNDVDRIRPNTDANSLGLEIHLMMYAFDQPQVYHLYNSIFLAYQVINRSSRSYESFNCNFYEGVALGNPNDDLVGSDSSRSMIYTYNRDTIDSGWGAFGSYPGAVAVFDPEANADYAMYYNNILPGIDTNSYGPRSKSHYYNLCNGRWRNGARLRLDNPSGLLDSANGSGYQTSLPLSTPTNWAFNDQMNWFNPPNLRYIPAMLLGKRKPSFNPGDTLCWNLIIAYANDSNDLNPYSSVEKLKNKSDSLISFYQDQNFQCFANQNGLLLSETKIPIKVYPQPAESQIYIEWHLPVKKLSLISLDGKVCLEQEVHQSRIALDCYNIPSGLYLLKLEDIEGRIGTKKVIIQK